MSCFCVKGGVNLKGEIDVSGSKNAILPLLSSCLLTSSSVVFHGVPRLRDVETMIALLRALGVDVRWQSAHSLSLSAKELTSCVVPLSLVRDMRASILVIGPILARLGRVEFLEPGGCAIGQRPIDQHLKALSRMGVIFDHLGDSILGSCTKLSGSYVVFDCVTVTGTENLMMAAVLADGVTVLNRAACEPEIVDLAKCLNQMGADIEGAGTPTIRIKGVSSLSGVEYKVMPDRIEAGTYLCAVAATRGELVLRDACPYLSNDVLDAFRAAGCVVKVYDESTIYMKSSMKLSGVDIVTAPYPGFPTDLQAPFMVVNTVASGFSRVTEKIFEGRFIHVPELRRFGCRVSIEGDTACINGGYLLRGSIVNAPDLRAAAALVIAAMCAEGTSTIQRADFIERGYESMPEKLAALGAVVKKYEMEQCIPG